MDIRLTYQHYQSFYGDFTFIPLTGVRCYNHFVFKVYSKKHRLNGVFNTERNKEVLDINYVIAIRRKITAYSIPQTRVVATHLQHARESLVELSNISYENKKAMVIALGTLLSLKHSMEAYKDAQNKLRSDLKLLLSSNQIVNPCKITTADIEALTSNWQEMSDDMESCVRSLMGFNCVEVSLADHAPVLTARIQVDCLVAEMRNILQVQGMIIHLLYGWKALRKQHEKWEMMN